ncbi:MAG: LAGLIDADG family homing endonuclease, partial [Halobellus sp.]
SAMHEALEQQSYHPDSEILLSDGRRVDIGPFVDSLMDDRADEVVDGVDCEILPIDDVGVHTVDLDANDVDKVAVDRVSRHEAPEEFVRVTFSNGRSVTVTPEHPMFVDDGGSVGTVDAVDISEGDFVPAPRKLPNSTAPMPLADEEHRGKERDVDLPEELSPDLAEVLGFLTAEGHSYSGGRTHEIGFSNQDERLLARMDRLMTDVFGLESTDAVNGAGTTTKRWVSTKLYRWFESNFPEVMEKSRQKRMPAAVLGASEEEIRRFLVGAFAGDGGVESEAMSFSTASPGLAEDYADALLKIGVASRIHHDDAEDSWKTYVMGDSTERFVEAIVEPADDRHAQAQQFVERSTETERHHDVLPTSAARELRSLKRLLGVPLDGRFRPALDEGYGVQISTVEAEIDALRERIEAIQAGTDAVSTLAEARELVGWSGRQLAERLPAATASAVHYAEDGGYTAARRAEMRTDALEAIRDALDEAEERLDALESRCDLRYYRVRDVETVPNEGEDACEWVYDVTVEPTNTFVSQGVVLHNSISISKAGINATLKSRCSLLGAANPKYGRFDQYEPIGEQIDLEPALISRFDLIFTVTDDPDPEADAELAEHIIQTNYAGELHTQKSKVPSSEFTDEEVDSATEDVTPAIDAELLRKYIAYAKRNCYPTMTEEAKEVIRDFYVDFRAKGADEDAPVPVTARKLEALVRLSEASARLRLSDTVDREDAVRVTDIVESCLRDIGMDPETGEFDADIVETGTSKNQRDRIKNLKHLVEELEAEYEEGAPVDEVIERATADLGLDEEKAQDEIEKLKRKGEMYEPRTDYLRTT